MERKKRRWVRWTKGLGLFVLLITLFAVVGRLMLPSFVRSYVNRVLSESPDYDGSVGEVGLSLWRGAYTIYDIKIIKTTGRVPVPFFESPRLDLSMDWPAALRGKLRGTMRMQQPRLNFVHGPSAEESQTGADQPWLAMLDELFPFRLDKAEIVDGRVHFHTFHTTPKIDIYIAELQASVENLTNVEDKLDPLIATVQARGLAMNSGKFELDMHLDPESHRPSFDLATKVIDLDVRTLNSMAKAYGGFDFEEGKFDFVVELSTKDGFLQGYAKPLFRDAIVLGPRDLRTDNPFQAGWEAIVGAVGTVLENRAREQFGTRFTLEGDFDDPRTSMLEIIGNVLRNAFVQAYLPNIEGRIAPSVAKENRE